jgi:hypothetical protein
MPEINRRSFLHSLGALVPGAALAGCAGPEAAEPVAEPLEPALLRSLAGTVLPSELGEAGIDRVVAGFRGWLLEFEPVAELNHGYGTGELEYTAADPAPGWNAQLRALDLRARREGGRGFAELDAGARRELVRRQVPREGTARLPGVAEAPHVAVGLLAYFYRTPEANDLCHRAAIGRQTCRPLARAALAPAALGAEEV